MGHIFNDDCYTLYHQMRARELHEAAARERLARQARRARQGRRPHVLRQNLGRLLIMAGETLACQPLDACAEGAAKPSLWVVGRE